MRLRFMKSQRQGLGKEEDCKDTGWSVDRWLLTCAKRRMGWDPENRRGLASPRGRPPFLWKGEKAGSVVQVLACQQSWKEVSIFEEETSKREKEVEVREEQRIFKAVLVECAETSCQGQWSKMYGQRWAGILRYQSACWKQMSLCYQAESNWSAG